MGQKVNPTGMRLKIIYDWKSAWYDTGKDYTKKLHQDLKIRDSLSNLVRSAAVSDIRIECAANKTKLTISSSKPGVIISKKGEGIEKIKNQVKKHVGGDVVINVVEDRKPDLSASLLADSIASQIEKRVSYRSAMRRAIRSSMRSGAKGIKIIVAGRLGGAEIARKEELSEGSVPLHTLRADISYAIARANTTYGVVGVKVYVYRGDKNIVERW